jgi:class 3 adenylate cyclase/TolB-like protein/Flp pilus assembly protein TadD
MAEAGEMSGAAESSRRLATIVSIDAAGYSRQSEIDEAAAVREVTALRERIYASAQSRGGRVFNTAGDGFMLEFPSVSSALAAAEEVQAVERVPLRIGLHVGEIHETPTGDLLGKGVNIAARLMALAPPGNIVLSGDVKRALSSDAAARLRPLGLVRLNKMSGKIEAFALGSAWKQPRAIPGRWILAGVAAIALGAFAWFGGQSLIRPQPQAIAVLEFRAFEPTLQEFTASLSERLTGALSTNDLQAVHTGATADEDRIAVAKQAGAAFVLDGSARAEGGDLLVSSRVIDTRGNLTLWSREYRRVAAEQSFMQEQIAFDVARVLRCALISMERQGGVDAGTLAVFLRVCQSRGGGDYTPEERHQAAREVTERAPQFSRGWSTLALIAADMSQWGLPPEETQALVAEARDAAARARQLDRSNGESFIAESLLLPQRDFSERQVLITQALEAEQDLAAAHAAQAALHHDVGRSFEALRSLQRAIAIEPLNGDYQSILPPLLNAMGNHEDAQQKLDYLYRIWPESPGAWWNRLMNSSYNADPSEALSMLDDTDSSSAGRQMREPVLSHWRAFLLARQSGDRARMRRAALAMRELIPGQFSRASVAAALSLSGEVDASFEIAEGMLRVNYGTGSFFLPPWRNLRRDPRFMGLIRDTGLIQYWRETDRWPDFCSERDLPYNCQEQAARVLPP